MADPDFQLRPYQIEHLGFHIAQKKSLNTSHPATGKTPTVCMFAYFLWEKHGIKTIWSMPQSLMRQNQRKMLRFSGFAEEDVVILESDFRRIKKSDPADIPTKERVKKIRTLQINFNGQRTTAYDLLKANPKARLVYEDPIFDKKGLITGKHWVEIGKRKPTETQPDGTHVIEPFRGPDGKVLHETVYETETVVDLVAVAKAAKVFICTFAFLREHWAHLLATVPEIDNFMVDEHHLGYKRPDSEQTESFFHIHNRVNYGVSMTGSLIDGPLDSMFSAIHVIEPRYYGSHVGFLSQHAGSLDEYGKVTGWINPEKLTAILKKHSVQITFKEAYGDEPMVHVHELIEVSPQVREEYDKFHAQAMLELDDGSILDGSLPGPATIRARQILGHPETFGLAPGEETGKDQRLRIFAADRSRLLVFSTLIPEQERIVRLLTEEGHRVGLINSSVSPRQRDLVDQALLRGDLDSVVASPPTAGVGYDWEFLDHVIYVSPDYQDVNWIQGYRRGIRGQRDYPLLVTTMEYEDTIEYRQYQIITQKSELAHSVDETRPVLRFVA